MLNNNQFSSVRQKPAAVLVVGGGIGGMRAALDLADAGLKAYLIEQTPCLGGRVAQLGYMFPQHDCVLCRGTPDHGYGCTRPSISPAYFQNNQHPNIEILTNTHITELEGQAGDFTVSLRQEPRYVDESLCINCGYCLNECPVELPDSYQQSMTTRKAIYKVSTRAAPDAYVIDRGPYCDTCRRCVEVCPSDAINLDQQPRLTVVEVGAVILAIGFKTYDPHGLEEFGYERYPNVISAMEYERLASRSGPTEGIINRPSDTKNPKRIAWLQCIGSRDQENAFCSSICCMYATKEAMLAKQRLGNEVDCSVFIMDERAFNKEYSTYFENARSTHKINYHYGRISDIKEIPQTNNLLLEYAAADGNHTKEEFDLVVLATGLQPPDHAPELAKLLQIELNEYGFCETDKFTPLQTSRPGVFVCGAFSSPKEIAETILDASGAAAEVMRLLNERLNTHSFTREWPFLSDGGFPEEIDVSKQDPKVGFFSCTCGDTLSKSINFPQLNASASKMGNISHSEIIDYACFPANLKKIKDTIREKGLNRVVVAACSNRTHESLFQRTVREAGLNPYLMELVNIREQCATVHQWQSDLVNQKATELVRVGVGRILQSEPVYKEQHKLRKTALVIGGGLSGMTTSLVLADSGAEVHLVERSAMLGGNLTNLYYVAEGYNPQRLLRDLVNRVHAHKLITIHTHSEVMDHRGHVGFFQSVIHTKRNHSPVEEFAIEHGVTIVATGGQESKKSPLLEQEGVLTQRELENLFIHSPEKIAALNDVVMIQCIGEDGFADYCSRVCCTNAMKNAIRIKLFNPNCRVTVLYKNIVTYGFREEYFTEARRLGTLFIRFTEENPPEISTSKADGSLIVKVTDMTLNRELSLRADLIPISTAVAPSDGTPELAQMLKVPLSSEGFYQEAQLKLRPMDFLREGIFLAGMAAYPKFIEETISHALAAAARALPLLSQEKLYLGGVIAFVDPQKCVGCLTCTRVCPFAIPQVIESEERFGVGDLGGAAYIDSAQCQGCGTCTGECPANAIQLVHYTDEQIMLKSIQGLGSWQADPITVVSNDS
ncbi:MAG: FAD-dependent oxidoreductase [Chloroflexota bacterium]